MNKTTKQQNQSEQYIDSEPNIGTEQFTVKPSKQLSHYYRHRQQINQKRRTNYQRTKKPKPLELKNLNTLRKSNDTENVLNSPVSVMINGLNKPIYTLLNLLESASEISPTYQISDTVHNGVKPILFVLPEIVRYAVYRKILSFNALEFFNEKYFMDNKVSKRQLKRAVQLLVNLKWLLRLGKGVSTVYYPNPFLAALHKRNNQWSALAEYTRLKIDFFELLNLPLINALRSNRKMAKTIVEFNKYERGSRALWIRAFFEGFVNIELHTEYGDVYQTYLPVNLHASPKLEWKNGRRIQNRYGFPHHTIPLKWILFDVIRSQQYTKKSRKSRWSKNIGICEYIHFDGSFKILQYIDKIQYLTFNKPFKYALRKWNNDRCEYVEVGDFSTLKKLFHIRFVENRRREELFEALGLKFQPIYGRPKKR